MELPLERLYFCISYQYWQGFCWGSEEYQQFKYVLLDDQACRGGGECCAIKDLAILIVIVL